MDNGITSRCTRTNKDFPGIALREATRRLLPAFPGAPLQGPQAGGGHGEKHPALSLKDVECRDMDAHRTGEADRLAVAEG